MKRCEEHVAMYVKGTVWRCARCDLDEALALLRRCADYLDENASGCSYREGLRLGAEVEAFLAAGEGE